MQDASHDAESKPVLPRQQRWRHESAGSVGCAVGLFVLLAVLVGPFLDRTSVAVWFFGVMTTILIAVVSWTLLRRWWIVRDDRNWLVNRTIYRPVKAWKVFTAGPSFTGKSLTWEQEGCVLFLDDQAKWWVIRVDRETGSSSLRWPDAFPATITVDLLVRNGNLAEVDGADATIAYAGTVGLSGPAILRQFYLEASPVTPVNDFNDLPPELQRAVRATGGGPPASP